MAECRSLGWWSLLDAVERYEAAKRKWVKQTSKHGFKRPDAAKPNHTRGIWSPYSQPSGQSAGRPVGANQPKHKREE